MKSAQKISHAENNYTIFSGTKELCIITRNNLLDLAITMLYLHLYSALKVTNQFYFENNHFLITQSNTNSCGLHQILGLRGFQGPDTHLFSSNLPTISVLAYGDSVNKMGCKLIQVEIRQTLDG